jgi:hypothetical protein
MGKIFRNRTQQAFQTGIFHCRRLVQHGTPRFWRSRQIEFIEKLAQRPIKRMTGRDAFSGPCEPSLAHRFEAPPDRRRFSTKRYDLVEGIEQSVAAKSLAHRRL